MDMQKTIHKTRKRKAIWGAYEQMDQNRSISLYLRFIYDAVTYYIASNDGMIVNNGRVWEEAVVA
jgi:hypothetical protein